MHDDDEIMILVHDDDDIIMEISMEKIIDYYSSLLFRP